MKITEHIDDFGTYLATATRLLEGTRKRYTYEVSRFAAAVGNPDFEQLAPLDLLRWHGDMQTKRMAVGTQGQKHAALRAFCQYMSRFERSSTAKVLLETLEDIHVPRGAGTRRETHALPERAVEQLLTAALARPHLGIRDHAIIHFLRATGVRRAELRDLKMEHLDLADRMAVVTGKGDKTRPVVFDQACSDALSAWFELREAWRPEADNVFLSARGKALALVTVSEIVRETAAAAGFKGDVWTHIFRHTAVSNLLDRGMAIQDVATFAGHANVATTFRYFHQQPGRLKEEYDKATSTQGS